MILMTKKEAERQLNKQLTNQEYNKYIYTNRKFQKTFEYLFEALRIK